LKKTHQIYLLCRYKVRLSNFVAMQTGQVLTLWTCIQNLGDRYRTGSAWRAILRCLLRYHVANFENKSQQIIQLALSSGSINAIKNTVNITNYRNPSDFMKNFRSGQPTTNISSGWV